MSGGVTQGRTISSKISINVIFCFGFTLKSQLIEIFEKRSKEQQYRKVLRIKYDPAYL